MASDNDDDDDDDDDDAVAGAVPGVGVRYDVQVLKDAFMLFNAGAAKVNLSLLHAKVGGTLGELRAALKEHSFVFRKPTCEQVEKIMAIYEEARGEGLNNKQIWPRIQEMVTGGWSASQLTKILKEKKRFCADTRGRKAMPQVASEGDSEEDSLEGSSEQDEDGMESGQEQAEGTNVEESIENEDDSAEGCSTPSDVISLAPEEQLMPPPRKGPLHMQSLGSLAARRRPQLLEGKAHGARVNRGSVGDRVLERGQSGDVVSVVGVLPGPSTGFGAQAPVQLPLTGGEDDGEGDGPSGRTGAVQGVADAVRPRRQRAGNRLAQMMAEEVELSRMLGY
ncbi:hypothetical protein Vretifemale_1900 [Volvox reticuliferus]|nr:hypothetical protein Vretifemale_1900 [Volvox reticuliferus]